MFPASPRNPGAVVFRAGLSCLSVINACSGYSGIISSTVCFTRLCIVSYTLDESSSGALVSTLQLDGFLVLFM
ncbi:hypothetical protein TNCV_4828601 [Trichonephila clavipes]|uniref:Uncharacterized protein n=1 Tax=Trichonephila clavipes TaxID=2585209 RepID=A0A8X6SJ32_TRICX|nr:hypothetical protein TNCV_4828601 [Trichonephila clavipes]